MASSSALALRRFLSSTIIPRSVRPAASLRLFNTNAVRSHEDGDDRNHRSNRTVSSHRGGFFSDMLDPFTTTRTFFRGLEFVNQLGQGRGWDMKEKEDALHLRVDMPRLSREDVKLALEEDNTLLIKGKVDEEEDGRKFLSRVGLPEKVYKTDEIKAEMKNGVLKVVVPKMKEDEH